MPVSPSFGQTVRDLRKVIGLTQKALAERLSAEGLRVSAALVSRVERDAMGPALSRPLVDGLARVLGADAEALWAAAQATIRATPATPPKATPQAMPSGPDALRGPFEKAMRQWLASAGYKVGLDAGAAALETKDFTDKVLGVAKLVVSAPLPMAVTGGAEADEVLAALAPFLAHADLLAYRVHLGTPQLLLVVFADRLDASALHARFAHVKALAQPLVDFGAGFNGRGMQANVHPLLVYLSEDGWGRAEEALRGSFLAPTPKDAALGTDRVHLSAAAIGVPARRVRWAEPAKPPSALVRGLNRFLKSGLGAFGVRTDVFTDEDLQTVLTLAEHHARS